MKIGIQFIGIRASQVGVMAKATEDAGLDGVWLASPYGHYVGYARAVEATERITVASSIMPCFYATPLMHAQSARALQEASGGRFILGMGSQTKGQIRTEVGMDPPKPVMMAKEMLQIIRAVLYEGRARHDGEYYKLNVAWTRSGHETGGVPPSPIYFSGVNTLNLRVAGEVTDGLICHPIYTVKYFNEVVWPNVEKGLERAGKTRADFDMCAMPMIWIAENEKEREEGYRIGRRNLANYYSTRAYGTYMDFHGWTKEGIAIREVYDKAMGGPIDGAAMEACVSNEIVDEVCLIGTPEEVRQKARERYEGIADRLLFYSFHDGYTRSEESQLKSEQNLYRVMEAFRDQKLSKEGASVH